MELRTLQDWVITPALKTVPGVADNLSFGGEVKQYPGAHRPGSRSRAYGLALDDVSSAIGKNNQNSGGNFVQHGGLQYIVRGIGLLQSAGRHRQHRRHGPKRACRSTSRTWQPCRSARKCGRAR